MNLVYKTLFVFWFCTAIVGVVIATTAIVRFFV
jgi:hypothetical protein